MLRSQIKAGAFWMGATVAILGAVWAAMGVVGDDGSSRQILQGLVVGILGVGAVAASKYL